MKNLFRRKEKKTANIGANMLPDIKAISLSPDEMAELLETSPEMLRTFEERYQKNAIDVADPHDLFAVNSRQAAGKVDRTGTCPESIIQRIVDGLLGQCEVLHVTEDLIQEERYEVPFKPVTQEELMGIAEPARPWLTEELMKKDLNGDTASTLLYMYKKWKEEGNRTAYHMFRQGLDILDLDGITYEMLGMNPTSMGNWLPQVAAANLAAGKPFRIPDTRILRVPITMLQLTRQPYEAMNGTTLSIVDRVCHKVFQLDDSKPYFIKTGTYSSKFDFRNCLVTSGKEVQELGEYLLYIHSQALMAAGPLSQPSIYGMSTTNEWCVREYVEPVKELPRIYKGLPLRTEFRMFIDFDAAVPVIGQAPYWDPDTMKSKFAKKKDIHDEHDWLTYSAAEKQLMAEYERRLPDVMERCIRLARNCDGLHGQYSVDIMANGDDLWLIDMAVAENSAFYERVPPALRNPMEEEWLPRLA